MYEGVVAVVACCVGVGVRFLVSSLFVMVWLSEVLVDWIKHALLSKYGFNWYVLTCAWRRPVCALRVV